MPQTSAAWHAKGFLVLVDVLAYLYLERADGRADVNDAIAVILDCSKQVRKEQEREPQKANREALDDTHLRAHHPVGTSGDGSMPNL